MARLIPRYEHFCQDSGCNYYHFAARVESKPFEMLSDLERNQLELVKRICKERCSKTAYQFYKWQKERGLTNLTSNFD